MAQTDIQEEAGKQLSEEDEQERQEEQENIYIGLIHLTDKIIDNFDISLTERVVHSKNLINEIFTNFLFASIFTHDRESSLETLRIKPKKSQRKSTK